MHHLLGSLLPLAVLAVAVSKVNTAAGISLLARSGRKHERQVQIHQASHPVGGSSGIAPTITVALTNHQGMQYSGPVRIGGQDLVAIYDTGSIEVMALSTLCKECKLPADLKAYDSGNSQSFKSGPGNPEVHYYAGQEVTARQDYETVAIGVPGAEISASNMMIWQVMGTTLPMWTTHPQHCKFSTILGLGHSASVPDTNSKNSDVQVLERVQTRFFTICLQAGSANPGYISFNPSIDLTAPGFSSNFRRLPVIGDKHWAVRQTKVSFDQGAYVDSRCGNPGECVAIIDSGTSLIGVPDLHFAFISGLVDQLAPDCSNLDTMPDVLFDLAGHQFALPSSAYVLQLPAENGQKKCYHAFMPLSLESDLGLVWVLGLPFLRHFYTVWDRQQPSLYVAKQTNACSLQSSRDAAIMLNNSNTLELSRARQAAREPTIGDIQAARLPSWAPKGRGKIIL